MLSRVAETRYGILQYSPCETTLAQSLESYGEWLQPQLDLLAGLLPSGAVVVEAASGIGAHALALARLIGTSGHLLTYEADPVLLRMLRQNLQINAIGTMVTVMSRDLLGLTPSVSFQVGVSAEVDSSRTAHDVEHMQDTVDDLGLSRLDLLKINDAGAAIRIFEGASETLWRLRPALFIDISNIPDLGQWADRVRDFGYRSWSVHTALYNPRNFNCRSVDVFDGRTALALCAIPEEREIEIVYNGCAEIS